MKETEVKTPKKGLKKLEETEELAERGTKRQDGGATENARK